MAIGNDATKDGEAEQDANNRGAEVKAGTESISDGWISENTVDGVGNVVGGHARRIQR